MADDQSQRPYRASEPPPARGSGKTGSDPLAELARLIGQTDPFGEYGREVARRSPPSQSAARADWNQPLGTSYSAQYGGDARAPEPAPRYAGDGYASADMALWDCGPEGTDEPRLVAYATQLFLFSFAS